MLIDVSGATVQQVCHLAARLVSILGAVSWCCPQDAAACAIGFMPLGGLVSNSCCPTQGHIHVGAGDLGYTLLIDLAMAGKLATIITIIITIMIFCYCHYYC